MSSPARAAAAGLATARDGAEIHYYLNQAPRQLPSRLLYDALGSTLFDAICLLPWYRITRAKQCLLAGHWGFRSCVGVADRGRRARCGNGDKIVALLGRCRTRYLPFNSSTSRPSARSNHAGAAAVGATPITAVHATNETASCSLPRLPADAADPVFLGSNIGNFDDPPAASAFLHWCDGRWARVLASDRRRSPEIHAT